MLTEHERKVLTRYIEECWHEIVEQPPLDIQDLDRGVRRIALCSCGKFKHTGHGGCRAESRTFDTWDDLGVVKEKLVERGEWILFSQYAFDNYYRTWQKDHDGFAETQDLFNWLMNPSRFCQMVADWREGDEG